jgi:hypothetical protein
VKYQTTQYWAVEKKEKKKRGIPPRSEDGKFHVPFLVIE